MRFTLRCGRECAARERGVEGSGEEVLAVDDLGLYADRAEARDRGARRLEPDGVLLGHHHPRASVVRRAQRLVELARP